MSNEASFRLSGVDALVKKLEGITDDLKKKGGRSALRQAAIVIQKRAQANAQRFDDPPTREVIADNVAVRWSPQHFKRTADLMFRVGVLGGARATGKAALKSAQRRKRLGQASLAQLGELEGAGAGNPGGDTWYWRLVEFGTEKTKAQPFLRDAGEKAAGEALSEFITAYDKALDKAIKKLK